MLNREQWDKILNEGTYISNEEVKQALIELGSLMTQLEKMPGYELAKFKAVHDYEMLNRMWFHRRKRAAKSR